MDLVLKDCGDFKMYLMKNDPGISKTLLKPKGHINREKEFMTVMREEVKPGMLAMDIGANIGFTTLTMLHCAGKTGRVIAAEPVKSNFKVLGKNIQLNNYQENTSLHRLAFSNKRGQLTFYESRKSNLGGLNPNISDRKGTTSVDVTTVDEFLQLQEFPHFYKMDIEGHEIQVLQGMVKTVSASKTTKILIEVHPTLYSNPSDMVKILKEYKKLGFGVKYVMSAAVAQPDLFKKKGYEPDRVFDSGGWVRGVYSNIKYEDMIDFVSFKHRQYSKKRDKWSLKIVRSILLVK